MLLKAPEQHPRESGLTVSRRAALAVSMIYAALAMLWIIISDITLGLMLGHEDDASFIQIAKGGFFVAATSILLYALLRRLAWRARQLDFRPDQNSGGIQRSTPVIILFFAMTLLGIGEWMLFSHQRETIRRSRHDELTAVADLKIAQISDWLNERIADSENIRRDFHLARHIHLWLQGERSDKEIEGEILSRMETLADVHGYDMVTLIDEQGRRLLQNTPGPTARDPATLALIATAIREKRPLISDIHQHF